MAWKKLDQSNLLDNYPIKHKALLDDVIELIDWERIEELLSEIHAKARGEKAWPPLIMFKALLLQSWYKLSDPALEKQLARDLLFKRFVGLSMTETVPDHSTIWRFRQLLDKHGLLDKLHEEFKNQLAEQGLFIRTGEASIIDASVIEAKNCRPNKGVDGKPTQDPDAAWNVKSGSDGKRKSTYGFKGHINVDEDGFIKETDFTPGNVHDSQCFEELLTGNEEVIYADSAYQSQAHNDIMEKKSIKNRIIKRAYRNRPLTEQDKKHNRTHSGVRCTVERVFGVLKLHYGMAKARYMGISRNRTRFDLMCIAYNIKRGVSIQQDCWA
jgi:IS5 family transposase